MLSDIIINGELENVFMCYMTPDKTMYLIRAVQWHNHGHLNDYLDDEFQCYFRKLDTYYFNHNIPDECKTISLDNFDYKNEPDELHSEKMCELLMKDVSKDISNIDTEDLFLTISIDTRTVNYSLASELSKSIIKYNLFEKSRTWFQTSINGSLNCNIYSDFTRIPSIRSLDHRYDIINDARRMFQDFNEMPNDRTMT